MKNKSQENLLIYPDKKDVEIFDKYYDRFISFLEIERKSLEV